VIIMVFLRVTVFVFIRGGTWIQYNNAELQFLCIKIASDLSMEFTEIKKGCLFQDNLIISGEYRGRTDDGCPESFRDKQAPSQLS
jgi:hypothetical protein